MVPPPAGTTADWEIELGSEALSLLAEGRSDVWDVLTRNMFVDELLDDSLHCPSLHNSIVNMSFFLRARSSSFRSSVMEGC